VAFVDGEDVKTNLYNHGNYIVEDSEADKCYVYGYANDGMDFFVAVESEKNPGKFFIDGTVDGKSVIDESNPHKLMTVITSDSCQTDEYLQINPQSVQSMTGYEYTIFLLN